MPFNVLIADDKAVFRRRLLRFSYWNNNTGKFTVAGEASNGLEALEKLEQGNIDLLITDIRMPFVDGMELLKVIHEKQLCPCTILFSEFSDFEYARAGIINGAFDYLLKSADESQLSDALDRAYSYLSALSGSPSGHSTADEIMNSVSPVSKNRIIADAQRLLVEHCESSITVKDLADSLFINPKYLGSLFRKETGMSIKEYQTRVKMKRAMQLLEDPRLKILEIADRLGYSDTEYFSRVFRESTGTTPSSYRRRIENGS